MGNVKLASYGAYLQVGNEPVDLCDSTGKDNSSLYNRWVVGTSFEMFFT